MNWPRRLFANRALRPALVIWTFGYILSDIVASLGGKTFPGVNFVTSIPVLILGVALTRALDALRLRLQGRPLPLRWTAIAAATIAAATCHALADVEYMRWLALHVVPSMKSWALNMAPQRILTIILLYLWGYALVLAMLWATRANAAAEISAARAAAFEAASHRAEAAALRLQLNPHFLFNTLNSISSLIGLDRKAEADAMIDQLADFLRASLASDPTADVSLACEIDAVHAYLSIEAARFGDRLAIDIEVPDMIMEAQVPNFILQPLVENAIKHGVSRVRGPASILVSAEKQGAELVLEVVNRSPGLGAGGAGNGAAAQTEAPDRISIGLANVRQRLAIIYGERGALETGPLPDGYRARIRMPLTWERRQQAAE
jgi:hypothetical protein